MPRPPNGSHTQASDRVTRRPRTAAAPANGTGGVTRTHASSGPGYRLEGYGGPAGCTPHNLI